MAGRLASFHGPSTPSSSPVQKHKSQRTPSSPSTNDRTSAESPHHRKTRTLLFEIKSLTETWDDLVLLDGLRAVKGLVDTRTELDNELAKNPRPRTFVVTPRLQIAEKHIADLDNLIVKLGKIFRRMNTVIESLETVLVDAYKVRGWKWCQDEPLWTTWPLEKFVTTIPTILPPYHRSLHTYTQFVSSLRSHEIGFEESKKILTAWAAQADLDTEGLDGSRGTEEYLGLCGRWEEGWEALCTAEVGGWERGK